MKLSEVLDGQDFLIRGTRKDYPGWPPMKGDLRCIEGRLFRHDPQWDDPDLETDVGQCPDCSGDGCAESDEPVSKSGRSEYWMREQILSILKRNRL